MGPREIMTTPAMKDVGINDQRSIVPSSVWDSGKRMIATIGAMPLGGKDVAQFWARDPARRPGAAKARLWAP
jgi:hypothetical protein